MSHEEGNMKKYRVFFAAFSLILSIFLLHACSSNKSGDSMVAMVSVPGGIFNMG